MLSTEEQREIEQEIAILPQRRSASIGALAVVQRHRGWISDETLADIAAFLGVSVEQLDSVASFYNLIFRRPVGRHVIFVCDSLSCHLTGGGTLLGELARRLQIEVGQTTADGRFTLLTIPCLATCDHAPALIVDDDTHRDLGPEGLEAKLDALLARYP